MAIIFIIVVVLVAAVLAFLVLIQSPKGGGLASNVGGVSNQFLGVKQTTDVLEKGTWIFAGIIALLCLFSSLVIGKIDTGSSRKAQQQQQQSGQQQGGKKAGG
jgi:preprotein translocase subunit SecG